MSAALRIASLLPSATEIVCALGLEDQLVAVTHECDYPPSVRSKPVVTGSVVPSDLPSAEIEHHIRRLVHQGSSIYTLDAEQLERLQPDLILTQELCAVCAVSYPLVEKAARRLDGPREIVSLEPERLEDLFEHIRLVGRRTGREAAAREVVHDLRARLDRVRRLVERRPRRRVVCLEWIEPLYNAGHWTPELVEQAGGHDPLGSPGEPSRPIEWSQVVAAAPEVLVVMPCGFSLNRTLREMSALARLPGWTEQPAVRAGEVYGIDGNAFFSRPGPRLVDSVEILAGLLHPDAAPAPAPESARRWP